MEWMMLLLAGLLEISWAVAMKYSEGFNPHPLISILLAVAYHVILAKNEKHK